MSAGATGPSDAANRAIDDASVHGRMLFGSLEVTGVEDLTPRMRRVTLTGPILEHFDAGHANTAVRLFFADADHESDLDDLGPAGPASVSAHLRTRSRVYTVRRFDAPTRRLDVDFVLHGHGIAAGWAAAAVPGSRVGLSGPRAHAVPELADGASLLLVADASAVPAAAAVLERLSPAVTGSAVFLVAGPEEELELSVPDGVTVRWLHHHDDLDAADAAVLEAVARTTLADRVDAWVAGEFGLVRALRNHLRDERKLPPDRIRAYGYWRRDRTSTDVDDARAVAWARSADTGELIDELDIEI